MPEVIQGHLGSVVPAVTSLVVLPTAIDGVLRRGMAKTPAERFGSCRELIAAAHAAVAAVARPGSPPPLRRQGGVPSASVSAPERTGPPRPPAPAASPPPSPAPARPVRLRDPLPAQPASFATAGGGAGWVMPVLLGLVAVVLLVVVILAVVT